MTRSVLLAGCGKMGEAMLTGWLEQGIKPSNITIIEPNDDTAGNLRDKYRVSTYPDPENIPPELSPDVVVFAVKPQMMDKVAPAYARYNTPQTAFLSIAAGKPVDYFEKALGASAAIVRAMPNTPAAVRRGITVAFANTHVSDTQRQACDELLHAVGSVEWTDDEGMIDAVTALSGGGPAYVFLLAEVMAEAGRQAGLPSALAERLARETVSGAGELLHQSDQSSATLRINVTSPGGTTAEALAILMADDGLQPLMTRAIKAAQQRSRELAG
ncbi:MAG: pyrroline-5-carboxylate reductase [Rhodospirillales bacterium]|nr:pyrroline-5-carboxylate reductase [Rhodospirillales bacterium]